MYILLHFFWLARKRGYNYDCPSTQERAPFVLVEYYLVLVFVLV